MLSRRRILLGVVLATAIWELLVAILAAPYLTADCVGWCWSLRLAYAVPILVLPALVQRLRASSDRILIALLALVATVGTAYVTFLGLWIFQSRDWLDARALVVTAVLVVPQLLALPIILGLLVVVVVSVRASRNSPREENPTGP